MVEVGDNLRERRRVSADRMRAAETSYSTAKARLNVQKAQLRLLKREARASRAAERSEMSSKGLKTSFWSGKVVPVRRSRDGKRAHNRRLFRRGETGEVVGE